jgi:hypothetical protein
MLRRALSFAAAAVAAATLGLTGTSARADTNPFDLSSGNFFQDWSNINLITTDNDWSGVPSITGYLGDYTAANPTDVDPRTLTGTMTDLSLETAHVIANQTSPNTLTAGGFAEFHVMDAGTPAQNNPTVAFQATDAADAPFMVLFLNTTGRQNVVMLYNLRDIDTSADDGDQLVDLQYRVGDSGDWTGLVLTPDMTLGPNAGSPGTGPIPVFFPDLVNDYPLVQVRWITTNSADGDEWVGIDDIEVRSQGGGTRVIPEPSAALLLLPLLTVVATTLVRRRIV